MIAHPCPDPGLDRKIAVRKILVERLTTVLGQPEIARVLPGLITALTAPIPTPASLRLTDQKAQVLRLVAAGNNTGEIAAQLGITEHTVKTHIRHILTRLGARSRSQAVAIAYEIGLLP